MGNIPSIHMQQPFIGQSQVEYHHPAMAQQKMLIQNTDQNEVHNLNYGKKEGASASIRQHMEMKQKQVDSFNNRVESVDGNQPNSDGQGHEDIEEARGRRRSKNDHDGRDHKCKYCDKTYLSYPALYTHTKQKHSVGPDGEQRAPPTSGRGRGRPRKSVSLIYHFNVRLSDLLKDRPQDR